MKASKLIGYLAGMIGECGDKEVIVNCTHHTSEHVVIEAWVYDDEVSGEEFIVIDTEKI